MDLSRLKTTRTIANLKAGRNEWYRIVKNQADASRTSVMLYDEIGWFGVTAQDFINDLKQVAGPIDLHLNSPGGEVFDGIAIHAFLAARGNVTTYVDSLAASIASVIAMAGTEIVMGRNASFMVHDGFGLCIGNAADMREQADLLDRVSDNIASIYADRTGKPKDGWRTAMLAETWYIGQEAVDAGLADRLAANGSAAPDSTTVVPGADPDAEDDPQLAPAMAAHFDLSIFRNTPASLKNSAEPAVVPPPAPPPEPAGPADEAPVESDGGFVVPEVEVQGEHGPDEPAPQEPAAEQEPAMDTARVAEELLALMRDGFKQQYGRAPTPLGMDTMPLLNKAIAVHHTPTVDTPWDGPAAVAAMPAEYADLHYCHAWQSADADSSSHTAGDSDADDKKSAYKMPHHAKKDGPANLPACRNGLARLDGADIPDGDKPGVKAHLQAHLDDANKDDDEDSGDTKNHAHDDFTFAWDPSMTAALKEALL
jgi:ATP-dependent protease ClpP protease subunit